MKNRTIKSGIIGILIGIILVIIFLLAAAVTVWGQVKQDYGQDVKIAKQVGSETIDSVSTDYIITGLVLSEDFQVYLDEGVNKGWWTQEFLDQYLVDYSVPILVRNYYDIIKLVIHTDPVQKLADILGIAKEKIPKLLFLISVYLPEIKVRIAFVLDHKAEALNKLEQVIALIENNKDRVKGLLAELPKYKAQITHVIALIPEYKQRFNDAKNDIASLKNDIINKVEIISVKLEKLQHLQELISATGVRVIIKNAAIAKLKSNPLFTNVDGSSFTGKERPFNFLDLYIPKDRAVYDNHGTTANLKDDTLEIPEADIGFEINENPHIDVLIGQGILVKGARALPFYNAIEMINIKY